MGLVVVSGGGSGIGRAAALRLAADGHTVLVVGRRLEALERTRPAGPDGRHHDPGAADLSTPQGAEAVAAHITEEGRPLDAVVAAAGGRGPYGSSDDSLTEIARVWQTAFDMNVLTAVLLGGGARPRASAAGRRDRALRLAGRLATERASDRTLARRARCTATRRHSRSGSERDGITANLIAPGYVPDTEFFGDGGVDPSFHEQLIGETDPRPRRRPPTRSPRSSRWLVHGNSFTTGQVISANGGAGLLAERTAAARLSGS